MTRKFIHHVIQEFDFAIACVADGNYKCKQNKVLGRRQLQEGSEAARRKGSGTFHDAIIKGTNKNKINKCECKSHN